MLKLFNTRNISLLIFIFINVAFCIRYAIRVSYSLAIVATLIYILISCGIIIYSTKKSLSLKWIFSLGTLWISGCIVLLHLIPLETIRVDRVEMIELFWNAASEGEYPYNPRGSFNGNHPGPMPIYFILCYPFYLIKQYALIPILSLVGWVYYTYRTNKDNTSLLFLLIITSPACYWEIVCRSTIIFNALIFILWYRHLMNFNSFSTKSSIISAIIGGIVLSTRSIFAIPIIAFGIYAIKNNNISNVLTWGVTLFLSFVATHLPLLFYGIDNVMNLNPIWLQSNFFIPTEYMIICVILLMGVAFLCKNFNQISFVSGIFLFGISLAYIIRYICYTSISHSITHGCDISYFLFSVPFLFLFLNNHNSPCSTTKS